MRCLILGANGLLGNAMLRVLNEREDWEVIGTVRAAETTQLFSPELSKRLLVGCDVERDDDLIRAFQGFCPDVVINCVSPSKDLLLAADPLRLIPICALLPHRLAALCAASRARLVHISTDGVFSGKRGWYTEDDPADAIDLYGRTKLLGEPSAPHTITLRTSMVGHELGRSQSLLGWFLAQEGRCKCYNRAMFSGLPTIVLAQIIRDIVVPRPDLSGVYHIAAAPISKCDLLRLIADIYGKNIELVADDQVVVDRSLNPERFRRATGYTAPDWRALVETMHSYG